MAEQVVELSLGESKQVSFEAVPHEAKVYQVSVDGLTGSFKAIAQPVVPWAFSGISCFTEPSGVGAWYQINYSATITNIGDRQVTKTVTLWRKAYHPWFGWWDWYIVNQVEVTLAPGESYPYNSKDLIQYDIATYSYLADSDGYESAHCYTPAVPSGTL